MTHQIINTPKPLGRSRKVKPKVSNSQTRIQQINTILKTGRANHSRNG